jgi:hypothetical protein
MNNEINDNIPARTSPGLTRSSFATTRNRVANDICVPRNITKLPNSEQSYKGKVKTHNYINRQNQSTTENCENRNDPDLVQAFLKK